MENLFAIGLTNAVVATMLAVVVWCVTRVWRQPPLVALLWTLVLVKLVTPPLVTIPWRFERSAAEVALPTYVSAEPNWKTDVTAPSTHSPAGTLALPKDIVIATNDTIIPQLELPREAHSQHESTIERAELSNSSRSESLDWISLLSTVWLSGSAIWLLIAIGRLTRFHRALRRTDTCPDDVSRRANDIAAKLGVTSGFRLRTTDARLSPFVWPIGRPTIVLSRPLLAAMSHEETEMLLAHELAHVRRKDHWLRWFEFIVTAVYWWHPVVWWARHMIQRAEEQACDAWVVWAFPESAKRYASALFKAVQMATEHRSPAPLVASRIGSTGKLKERIEDIMNSTWTCRISKPGRITLALCVLLILPLSLRSITTASEQSPESNAKTNAAGHHTTDSNSEHNAVPTSPAPKPLEHRAPTSNSEPATNQPRVRVPANPYRIAAGDVLHVAVANAFADQPIADDCLVEPEGTIALGPAYGRAQVAGLTLEEADRAVTKHLGKVIQDPVVQVTLGGWRYNVGKWAGRLENATGNVQTAHNTVEQESHTSASSARLERPISPAELAALREHVTFLDDRFKSVDSLYQTGSRGGSADARARTGYELAAARVELAMAEGRRDQAITYAEQAETFAEDALKAVTASYESGRISLDVLLQTAKYVSESKRQLVRIREQASVPEQQNKPADDRAELKRELTQRSATSASNTSVTVWKKLVQRTKQKYDRLKPLADQKVVTAEELEAAKTDYEVSVAQYEHALRVLKYAQLEVELAQTELQEAASSPRTTGNSTDDFELKKLKIKLEMAKVKASELE